MARGALTDRKVQSLKPRGKPYDVPDGDVPGLMVRVMPSGHRSFVLVARYPGSKNPTRRALGSYVDQSKLASGDHEPTVDKLLTLNVLTLAEARLKAQAWRGMIGRSVDPTIEGERRKQAEQRRQENTFGVVFEAFCAEKLANERKGKEVERDIRNEFLPSWDVRPVTDVIELDVLAVINAKKKDAPAQARNLLGHVKRLFDWAIEQRVYGLKASPCQNLKPKKIIGKKKRRQRILSNDELFALWRAARRLPYPVGPVYRLLMLAALRLNEPADASWNEFDPAVARALRQRKDRERVDWTKLKPEQLVWTIPAERMKGKNEDARPHLVPLTPDVLQILESLPLFKRGDFIFTTTFGKKPVWIGDKIKKEIDARMLRTLKALARMHGDDPAKAKLAHWVNHDIRRTVRSNFSRLRVTEEAREAVLAHARPGIKGVYDLHDYFDEKREALELWAARLRSIVEPPPPAVNVVEFAAVRA